VNSINGNTSSQAPKWSSTHVRSKSSSDWIVLSDRPSVCGWYVELIVSLLPKAPCKVCQNRDVNRGSLSDTMLEGTPCNLTTSLMYSWANLIIDILRFMAKKCALLVSRSTMTQMVSCPLKVCGRWVTKSIEMLSHFHTGTSKGCIIPPGLWCSTFTFWQVRQADTYCATSFFIPCHQKFSLRSWYILVMPSCRLRRLLCPSSRINFFTSTSSGTHTLSWNQKMPSLPKVKSFASSDPSCSLILFSLASDNYLSLTEFRKSLDMVRLLHLMNPDSNSTCSFMSLNFSSSSTSLMVRWVVCTAFLLKASATTFTFPGLYKSSIIILQELHPSSLSHVQLLLIK